MATTYTTVVYVMGGDTAGIAAVLRERRERAVRAIPDAVAALVASGSTQEEAISAVALEMRPEDPGHDTPHHRHFRETPVYMALMPETYADADVLLASLRYPVGACARWGQTADAHEAKAFWGVHRETRWSNLSIDPKERALQMRFSTPGAAPMRAIEAFATEFPEARVVGGWYCENFDDLASFYSGPSGTGIVDLEPSQFAEWMPGETEEGRDEGWSDRDLLIRLIANAHGLEAYEAENPGYVRMP